MFAHFYSRDLMSEMDRLQREVQRAFEATSPSIRGLSRGFPTLNVGTTPSSVEIYAFAPGIDATKIEVELDRRVLTIAGERTGSLPRDEDRKSTSHVAERFSGRFRRVVSLPDDIDPDGISANYRDGVLQVSVKRRESAQPRRITVQ
jgi:HSP20 family protein